jgi:uncharacterized protein (DUF302 family)
MWYVIIGVGIGVLLTVLYFRVSLGRTMMLENESLYSFAETERLLFDNVAAKNWKILGSHDLKEKMAANGYEVLDARVYDLCKPVYASEILKHDAERIVSPLLPCRIAIYSRSNGKVYIGRMNSLKMAGFMPGVVPDVMGKAAIEVEEVLESIIKK